jgi:hypothetical protein
MHLGSRASMVLGFAESVNAAGAAAPHRSDAKRDPG